MRTAQEVQWILLNNIANWVNAAYSFLNEFSPFKKTLNLLHFYMNKYIIIAGPHILNIYTQ